jgi:F-type H+-transporting ATPase subunit c
MTDLLTIAQAVSHALPAADGDLTANSAAMATAIKSVGKGLAFGVAAGGAGIGIGLVFSSAIQGVARQPEQANALRGLMFLGFALIEALALIGFVLVFLL